MWGAISNADAAYVSQNIGKILKQNPCQMLKETIFGPLQFVS